MGSARVSSNLIVVDNTIKTMQKWCSFCFFALQRPRFHASEPFLSRLERRLESVPWATLSPAEQVEALNACVVKAAQEDSTRTGRADGPAQREDAKRIRELIM